LHSFAGVLTNNSLSNGDFASAAASLGTDLNLSHLTWNQNQDNHAVNNTPSITLSAAVQAVSGMSHS
jgi:hypothetical protein